MLNSKGFDLWAENYDLSVSSSHGYPFEGYYDVLDAVLKMIGNDVTGRKILDIGFGTGTLTNRLSKNGAQIYGIDFSKSMVDIARRKMPNGIFEQYDFSVGIPEAFSSIPFDYIISTYAIHHVSDNDKCRLFSEWMSILSESSQIIVGDISFKNDTEHHECKSQNAKNWDVEEIYFVYDNIKPCLEQCGIVSRYQKISACAGVMIMSKLKCT